MSRGFITRLVQAVTIRSSLGYSLIRKGESFTHTARDCPLRTVSAMKVLGVVGLDLARPLMARSTTSSFPYDVSCDIDIIVQISEEEDPNGMDRVQADLQPAWTPYAPNPILPIEF